MRADEPGSARDQYGISTAVYRSAGGSELKLTGKHLVPSLIDLQLHRPQAAPWPLSDRPGCDHFPVITFQLFRAVRWRVVQQEPFAGGSSNGAAALLGKFTQHMHDLLGRVDDNDLLTGRKYRFDAGPSV